MFAIRSVVARHCAVVEPDGAWAMTVHFVKIIQFKWISFCDEDELVYRNINIYMAAVSKRFQLG